MPTHVALDRQAEAPPYAACLPRQLRHVDVAEIRDQARRAALARRDRVLAHGWAASRLCEILRLERPGQWTGYVPPARDCHGRTETSPARALLRARRRDVDVAAAEAGGSAAAGQ